MNSVQKILTVDLSSVEWNQEQIDLDVIRVVLEGLGLSARFLFEGTQSYADPVNAENVVIVVAGLLTGTEVTTAYRSEITTKSPQTGIFESGNFGGLFGSRRLHHGDQRSWRNLAIPFL
jgi:aldehyde:ferredoxin oxidoreductase